MTGSGFGYRRSVVLCIVALFFRVIPGSAQGSDDFVHYDQGVKYKNENKYEQAVLEFRKHLSAYPDNYNAYMRLAEIRKVQNQSRLVIYYLNKSLAYNPGWGKAQKMLAEAYEQDGQYQNAASEYRQYLKSSNPSEQDSIKIHIDKLVDRIKSEPEPPVQTVEQAPVLQTRSVSGIKDEYADVKQQDESVKKSTTGPSNVGNSIKTPVRTTTNPQTAEVCFQQAVNLYNRGLFNEAIPFLKKAILLRHGYSAAFYYAGLIRYKLGQTDLAKIDFAKAFGYPDGEASAHFYMGKIYGTEKNYKEAIRQLTEYVQISTDSDQRKEGINLLVHYKDLAGDKSPMPVQLSWHKDGESENRITPSRIEPVAPESSVTIEMKIDSLLTMAVADTLGNAGKAMLGGIGQFKAGRFDDAIKEFKSVMVSYPANTVASQCLYDIGVCYMKLGLFPNAENQFDQVLLRYPLHSLSASSLFFKAYASLRRGESVRAEKLMRDFIQKYRSHQWVCKAYEKLGDIYKDLRQPEKAVDAYQQSSAQTVLPVDRQYILFKLGGACADAGNIPRALETYKKVIDIGEKNQSNARVPDSYFRIADNEYQQKDYKSALEHYQKATQKFSVYQETPWGLFQTANIYKNMHNFQKAIETYRLLMKTFPDDYWAKQAKWKIEDTVWENEYSGILN